MRNLIQDSNTDYPREYYHRFGRFIYEYLNVHDILYGTPLYDEWCNLNKVFYEGIGMGECKRMIKDSFGFQTEIEFYNQLTYAS